MRMPYTKATVKKDIETLLEEWRESRIKDIDLAQTLALERNRQHYEEVREEWERSKEDRTAKSIKRKGAPAKGGEDDEDGGSAIKTTFQERKVTTILGKGDPAYMDLMIRLEDQRAKILGLYAPEKKEISGKDGEPLFTSFGDLDLTKLSAEEKEALLDLARKCNK